MNSQTVKKYLPVLVVVTILILLNVFAVIWYVLPTGPDQWKNDVIPGKVVEMTEHSLVTRNPQGNIKTFIINPETQFFAGRESVNSTKISKGTLVLVEVDMTTTTSVIAKEVRIMTDKRKGKPTP
jgi:hypothetical protein